jgi:hypothetical protein
LSVSHWSLPSIAAVSSCSLLGDGLPGLPSPNRRRPSKGTCGHPGHREVEPCGLGQVYVVCNLVYGLTPPKSLRRPSLFRGSSVSRLLYPQIAQTKRETVFAKCYWHFVWSA